MKYRTIWISDVHLGTKASKVESLNSFLKENEAEVYYFVGDIIDGLSLQKQWFWPESHNQILRLILKISKKSIVNYIPGNHDWFLREYCPFKFGNINIETQKDHYMLDGRKFLIIHGDIFDYFVENSRLIWTIGGLIYDLMIFSNDFYHGLANKFNFKHKSLAQYIKNNSSIAINAINNFEKAALSYCKQKEYDGIITAHIHHPNLININNITYCNDGDWVDSCTALVETLQGELKLIQWHK